MQHMRNKRLVALNRSEKQGHVSTSRRFVDNDVGRCLELLKSQFIIVQCILDLLKAMRFVCLTFLLQRGSQFEVEVHKWPSSG
jgi:hypothetical protein